ncbi:MAG: glutamate-5-semialdehyde dehydrogenase [Bacteroidales bacterium]|nr:glutamate-5-semialdehyde dehydrogenase [Bacteroidales bacterium]
MNGQVLQQFQAVKNAARYMSSVSPSQTENALNAMADAIVQHTQQIVNANKLDLQKIDPSDYRYDRLKLDPDRLAAIAADTRNVAKLPAPCGEVIEQRKLSNGLKISRVRVPMGVVGVIYEARPNVTVDVVSIGLRSGNAVVLKGGSDAHNSNSVLVSILSQTLEDQGLNPDLIQLLPPSHEAATDLMNAVGYVDLLIPRGSQRLIASVRDNAKIPVIETGASVVHTYFDLAGDLAKGAKVICNAKTRRVSVCNALDCLLIHSARLADLPALCEPLASKGVELHADSRALDALKGAYPEKLLLPIQPDDYGREYLAMKLAIVTVDSIDQALQHIYDHSLKHSEAIITEDQQAAQRFLREVDAACCYVNASTAFTDGAQFGLGAEIGISTQKMHARGPMGLRELTSYKWIIQGDGHTRNP